MRLPFTKHNPTEPSGAANSDVELIRTKLVDAEAQITAAEAELDRLALRAVLADDSSAFVRHQRDIETDLEMG